MPESKFAVEVGAVEEETALFQAIKAYVDKFTEAGAIPPGIMLMTSQGYFIFTKDEP